MAYLVSPLTTSIAASVDKVHEDNLAEMVDLVPVSRTGKPLKPQRGGVTKQMRCNYETRDKVKAARKASAKTRRARRKK